MRCPYDGLGCRRCEGVCGIDASLPVTHPRQVRRVVELIHGPAWWAAGDVAQALQVDPSTTHELLVDLEGVGIAQKHPSTLLWRARKRHNRNGLRNPELHGKHGLVAVE